jgi:saccharopine dehydrogenase (NAD+, L-lysine-forming)
MGGRAATLWRTQSVLFPDASCHTRRITEDTMSRVTVLGGCGAVGSVAVRSLAATDTFDEIVIADIAIDDARRIVERLGSSKVSAVELDAKKPASIKRAIAGSTVALNCVGPFYEYGPTILKAAIQSKINYVDVCDDLDATEASLAMHEKARRAGISALLGMGTSPGVANLLVRFCAEALLDQVESVDIYHAHGGEHVEGAAVVKHRIHSMTIDVPMFLDGKFTTVRLFEDSGRALEEDVEFRDVGTYRVYGYPHPETITLPRYFKGLKRATNLGLVLPPAYAEIIKGTVRLGITTEEPIEVKGRRVIPLEFAVAFILAQRPKILEAAGLTGPMGCLKIVVKGVKKGEPSTYVFSLSSKTQGMGDATGIPAALGAMLMASGRIQEKGVLPPEACVKPMDLLQLAQRIVSIGDTKGLPIVIEHIDAAGVSKTMNLFG